MGRGRRPPADLRMRLMLRDGPELCEVFVMTPLHPGSFMNSEQRRELACKRLTAGERTREDTTPGEESKPRSPRARIRVHDEREFRQWEEVARRLEERRGYEK